MKFSARPSTQRDARRVDRTLKRGAHERKLGDSVRVYRVHCAPREGEKRPATDSWQAYAPMLTPRHGMGAAVVGDAIHVAGGGPMNGGVFQTSVHELFSF